jgi:hypothetical protein
MKLARAAPLGVVVTLVASTSRAVDSFEIQVYQAEVNRPGHVGLEVHANHTFRGHEEREYEGEIPIGRSTRLTFEPAIGVTEWLELGAYLQTFTAPGEGAQFGGAKLRVKVVVPARLGLPLFLGVNAEIGRVPNSVSEQGWANEFRPIVGWTNGWVLLDVNPIFGYELSGPDRLRPHFEPAGKAWMNTQQGFALGFEYYAGLGSLTRGFAPVAAQEHLAFAAFDLTPPAGRDAPDDAWELNVALGRGLTEATPQQWILKAIVGRAF